MTTFQKINALGYILHIVMTILPGECAAFTLLQFFFNIHLLVYVTVGLSHLFMRIISSERSLYPATFYSIKIINQNFERGYIYPLPNDLKKPNGTSTLYKNVVVDEVTGLSLVQYVNQ